MWIEQRSWTKETGWNMPADEGGRDQAQVVFVFGSRTILSDDKVMQEVRSTYPGADFIGCSTAGEICDVRVFDDTLVTTAVSFDQVAVHGTCTRIDNRQESFKAGVEIATELSRPDLAHVVVLSDGLHVNGSELVKGLVSQLPDKVKVTGGLSADGDRFEKTVVVWNQDVQEKCIAALGLYGDLLKVGYGSIGGWDPFGPERLITRSEGNVLYELDGRSALGLYKSYLGRHADDLPASGLLFPLMLRFEGRDQGTVRTILAVDEESNSLVFAGDVPEGAYARLMKANFDRLVDGAVESARASIQDRTALPEFALLISCVGRKMILKQRIEEEVEGVRDILGPAAVLTGFYSYGEISPTQGVGSCELHNQTMTVTTFSEP